MIVYTLQGSQGAYSDNSTWIEGVFASVDDCKEWVRLRPLADVGDAMGMTRGTWSRIESERDARRAVTAWIEDLSAQSLANRRRWHCSTHDPGDGDDIDWTIDEWQVGQPAGPKPRGRPCEVCQRPLVNSLDPEVIFCGRRDCIPVALQTPPSIQPHGDVLRKPRERKLQ